MNELTDDQRTLLLRLLEMIEQADCAQDAVWLTPTDRELVRDIRETIEA